MRRASLMSGTIYITALVFRLWAHYVPAIAQLAGAAFYMLKELGPSPSVLM